MKKVVLAVNNDFVLDMRIYREATSLVKAGHEVVVVGIKRKGDRLPKEERVEGFRIVRVELPDTSSGLSYGWGRVKQIPQILRYGKPFFDRFYKKLTEEHADVYHANDLDTLLPCYKAAKKNNSKIIYDMHDFFDDILGEVIDFHKNNGSFFEWAGLLLARENFKRIEKHYIKLVDAVIVVNPPAVERLVRRYNLREEPVVVNNYPILRSVQKKDLIRKNLGLDKKKKIVIFQGSINVGRGFEEIISSWLKIPDEIVLVLLGWGDAIDVLKNSLKRKNLLNKKIFFLPPVSKDKIFDWIASANVGIVPFKATNFNVYHSSPNKLYEYLLCGLPVVASNFPEIRKVVEGDYVGKTFDPEKQASIIKVVKEIFSNEFEYKKMRENAFKVVKEKYNWGIEEKKLLSLYRELFEENKG